eukprot:6461068-Amphidinium_carterae.1
MVTLEAMTASWCLLSCPAHRQLACSTDPRMDMDAYDMSTRGANIRISSEYHQRCKLDQGRDGSWH